MMSILELHRKISENKILLVTMSTMMSILVYIFTIIFSLYIPHTRGFFNFGEIGVYIAAILGGPTVGLIAGGLGSSLADITLGYYHYAPATLLIKAVEGWIVGFLSGKFEEKSVSVGKTLKLYSVAAIVALSFILYLLGSHLYVGIAEVTIAVGATAKINITNIIWISVSLVFLLATLYIIIRHLEASYWIVAMATGGVEMVIGYYIYQQFILGYYALAEIPFNIMQVLIGIFGAVTISNYLRRVRF